MQFVQDIQAPHPVVNVQTGLDHILPELREPGRNLDVPQFESPISDLQTITLYRNFDPDRVTLPILQEEFQFVLRYVRSCLPPISI